MASDGSTRGEEPVPDCFFVSEGDDYVGTALARGPWDPNGAHGGPVAALIGREVDRFDPDPELATVRLTIELLRPVPLDHLHLETTLLRPGKRVRLVGISLQHGDTEVARAVALRIKRVESDLPPVATASVPDLGTPELATPRPPLVEGRVGIVDGVELRATSGSAVEQGPATYWFRVLKPLVDDEPVSPLTRALIAADFGNGISSVLPIESHVFINPDLTVHLHRLPEGEWVASDAVTRIEAGGSAIAEATLADRRGPIGKAVQSIYVAAR